MLELECPGWKIFEKLIARGDVYSGLESRFCDASMKIYGCWMYLRFVHRSKFIKMVLVTSKSRIAPLLKQSIPKLKFLSCLLLVCLIKTLKKKFNNFYDILNFNSWTDFSVAYSWIVSTNKVFPVFIQNKVKEVRNLVNTGCFKLIDKDSWPSLKVGEKSILLSKIECKGNDFVCVTSFAKRLKK